MAQAVTEFARPKVNLTLRILGRRSDGYHELESLVAFAISGPADRLDVESGASPSFSMRGATGTITGENLVEAAVRSLAAALPGLALGRIVLEKALPIAAGIGGGSADAAALLRAVRRIEVDRAHTLDWAQLALKLGADVPVCLAGVATMMRGIGERLQPIDAFPAVAAVLVTPDVSVPADKTAAVFRRLAAPPLAAGTASFELAAPSFATSADVIDYVLAGGNDLAAPALALMPGLQRTLDALAQAPGCRVARMSGAGPTCFGLFENDAQAKSAAERLVAQYPNWWVAATRLGSTAPAG